jgi:hypothetical protein
MEKPGLGRGLGTLMNGVNVPNSDGVSPLKAAGDEPASTPLGRGLTNLLQGQKSEERIPEPPQSDVTAVPLWFFLGGDLLLLAVAGGIAFFRAPLGWMDVLFCGSVVVVGAVVASLPFVRTLRLPPPMPHPSAAQPWTLLEGSGAEPTYVLHLKKPLFIGEVTRNGGKVSVQPRWTADPGSLNGAIATAQLQQAQEFCRNALPPELKSYQRSLLKS